MQKKLNEVTKDELKTLGRDVAEIDHRYKKQICLLKTDLPMQTTHVAHRLIIKSFQIQNEILIPKLLSAMRTRNGGGSMGLTRKNAMPEAKIQKEEEMFETQQEIYEKIKLNMHEVSRKLEKNKVNMVTDFVERTETSRISTL